MGKRDLAGWLAVGTGTTVACLWAFWGSIENFHEGWWRPTLSGRIGESFLYLSPMIISIALSLVGIRFPKTGAAMFMAVGILFSYFVFSRRALSITAVLSWLPVTVSLIGIGLLFWFGRPKPVTRAYWIAAGLPVMVACLCAIEPAWRVSHRFYDGDRGIRLVEENAVRLIWAPEGPGWNHDPHDGPSWETAKERCAFLSEDGLHLLDEPLNIWRLPTVDEAVRSMTRGGKNAGGIWSEAARKAEYSVKPDKESPLWDIYSPKIYYWTASEADREKAYRITYDGRVWSMPKSLRMGSQGFRAVKNPKP